MQVRSVRASVVNSVIVATALVVATMLLGLTVGARTAHAQLLLRPIGAVGPLDNELLSDERTPTRTARAAHLALIRALPADDAATVTRLRWSTEDGYPEIYLVQRSYVAADGSRWLRIRIPGRPNGRVGWVRLEWMGAMKATTMFAHVRIGRDIRLYRDGELIFRAPVGTGAPGTPTPTGRFWIREKFRGSGGIYGPRVFGTADYSVLSEWPRGGVIGIHGTDQPQLIPGRPSHGCIRMRNADVLRLYSLMPVGTALLISVR